MGTSRRGSQPYAQLLMHPRNGNTQSLKLLLKSARKGFRANYDNSLVTVNLELEAVFELRP